MSRCSRLNHQPTQGEIEDRFPMYANIVEAISKTENKFSINKYF